MTLFSKIKARFTKSNNTSRSSFSFFNRKHAGVYVTQDNALTYSAVWRCVNLISQTIGALPWHVSEREFDSNGRKTTKRLFTHPASSILDVAANEELSAQHWRETVLAWALTWGNGYAEIERDRANRPIALWPIEPERVTPSRDDFGKLIYIVSNQNGDESILYPNDMFHLRGLGFDGLSGYSIIGLASRTIGLGLATEDFGADFFGNGAHVGGVFEHPNQLGDTAIDHLKKSILERQGGKNQLSPMILEEGMKYSPTSIPPDDAQFLETRKFNVAEIARWYGVPLHKLHEMDAATFSNIEHQSIEFVQDALIPWVKRFESEANLKLISPTNRNRYFTKLNLNSLLRGDMAARTSYYKDMSNLGVLSVNDVLELEDRNPIGKEGDKRLVQLNQTTLDKIGEENVEDQNALPVKENEEEGDEGSEDESEADIEAKRNSRAIMVKTFDRIISRESHRANDALNRYDERDDLFNWMDKFYNQQREYINENLFLNCSAIGIDEKVYKNFIDDHILMARLEILNAFDNNEKLIFTIDAETSVNNLMGVI